MARQKMSSQVGWKEKGLGEGTNTYLGKVNRGNGLRRELFWGCKMLVDESKNVLSANPRLYFLISSQNKCVLGNLSLLRRSFILLLTPSFAHYSSLKILTKYICYRHTSPPCSNRKIHTKEMCFSGVVVKSFY